MELIKNNRFRTGNVVDIYHTPVYESYTIAITDTTIGGQFEVDAQFPVDVSIEQFNVGDICAFSFGVGEITAIVTDTVTVQFPNSMFPDSDVMKYVGTEIQHCLFFLKTGRVEANFTVAKYTEVVNQATYGYAKVVYNLQTQAELVLTPIRLVDDGTLSKIMYSKGFVLGACDTTNYTPTTVWNQDFPLELSGTSIDPIYRRAYLTKRESEAKGRKSKAKMTFQLIG